MTKEAHKIDRGHARVLLESNRRGVRARALLGWRAGLDLTRDRRHGVQRAVGVQELPVAHDHRRTRHASLASRRRCKPGVNFLIVFFFFLILFMQEEQEQEQL
jgi:hypothetical protein